MTIQRHRARVMQQMGAEFLTKMVRIAEKLGVPSTTYVPEYPKAS
jgi:FixJ family two-component response regulator